MTRLATLAAALAGGVALLSAGRAEAVIPVAHALAFPTAEGYGRFAAGGRGGAVCAVTSLADSGPGTLRDCLTRTGPRTVVFRVGGTIVLNSQVKAASGQVTVAGQTAPGDGIAIRNAPSNLTGSPLFFTGSDAVIRYLRIRPGPTSGAKQDTTDAITIGRDSGISNFILDHVSLSWATDEVFNTTVGSTGTTIQWSLIYEDLSHSTHVSGEHSKCLFAEGRDISVVRTLVAHCTDRVPNFGTGDRADLVNSVQYDMGEQALQLFSMVNRSTPLRRQSNIVGNWASYGPSTVQAAPIYGAHYYPNAPLSSNPGAADIYLSGNIDGRRRSAMDDERLFLNPDAWQYVRAAEVGGGSSVPATNVTSADQAVRDVLGLAGAAPRDAADARVVDTVRGCSGRIIDDPSQVGGWPVLAGGTPYPDADGDGMDDRWEVAHGLNPGDVSDRNGDQDGDGYTNLEEFLNELAGDQDAQGNLTSRIGAGVGPVPPVNCGVQVSGAAPVAAPVVAKPVAAIRRARGG